jgi:transcriptional regulator with XRE-family HTH domain
MNKYNTGDMIKSIIKENNINICKLCIDIGCSRSTLYRILNNNTIDMLLLFRLCRYLKIDAIRLIENSIDCSKYDTK